MSSKNIHFFTLYYKVKLLWNTSLRCDRSSKKILISHTLFLWIYSICSNFSKNDNVTPSLTIFWLHYKISKTKLITYLVHTDGEWGFQDEESQCCIFSNYLRLLSQCPCNSSSIDHSTIWLFNEVSRGKRQVYNNTMSLFSIISYNSSYYQKQLFIAQNLSFVIHAGFWI